MALALEAVASGYTEAARAAHARRNLARVHPVEEARSTSQPPLAGVRILELGSFVAAPMAARIIADFGADVVKVEPPDRGDELRSCGTVVHTRDGQTISAW
jgi:crotonobetainyl-CoA:carnitine CoA-transferase CaiB-like acyl-CoA transferase